MTERSKARLVDPAAVSAIIDQVARTVIMPRFRNLGADDVHEKLGPDDLVTIADTEAERALSAQLTALLPGSLVVGEEAVAADPLVTRHLEGPAPVWILDPVDGTAVFAKGETGFAVIVALALGARTVAGWIHDPLDGRMLYAEAGQGAWMGSRRQRATADRDLNQLVGVPFWKKAWKLKDAVGRLEAWGSAGQTYMAMAEGRLDFAVANRLNPWDHAAGVLAFTEAGGTAGLLDGSPYRPVTGQTGLLLAPGPNSWAALRDLLRQT